MPRRIEDKSKRERLIALYECLPGGTLEDAMDAAEITKEYNQRHKTNLSVKLILWNLLELHIWSNGTLKLNSGIKAKPVKGTYLFWREK